MLLFSCFERNILIISVIRTWHKPILAATFLDHVVSEFFKPTKMHWIPLEIFQVKFTTVRLVWMRQVLYLMENYQDIISPFNLILPSTQTSMESWFSEIFPARNLVIAPEPFSRSKFCSKYGITRILDNRKIF